MYEYRAGNESRKEPLPRLILSKAFSLIKYKYPVLGPK